MLNLVRDNTVNDNYQLILQGSPINAFFALLNKSPEFDSFNNSADFNVNNVKFKIKNFKNLHFNNTSFRVFDYLLLKMTKLIPYNRINLVSDSDLQPFQNVRVSLADFMRSCHLSNNTKAQHQFADAINVLLATSIQWNEPVKRKRKTEFIFFDSRIISAFQPVRGGFLLHFDLKFLRYLSSFAYIMPYPTKILSIDFRRNPNSYFIVRYLLLHHNMNYFKLNSNTISIKTLLEYVPTLPSYFEVRKDKDDGHVRKRIIDPFERDLQFLKEFGILHDWTYSSPVSYKYKSWIKSLISFTFVDYPNREKSSKNVAPATST